MTNIFDVIIYSIFETYCSKSDASILPIHGNISLLKNNFSTDLKVKKKYSKPLIL